VKRSTVIPENEVAHSRNRYEVVGFVSTVQFICETPGQLPEGYGRKSKNDVFRGERFIMMLHRVSFGLKIKFLLVPMKR
jgi:hypothetical protein